MPVNGRLDLIRLLKG